MIKRILHYIKNAHLYFNWYLYRSRTIKELGSYFKPITDADYAIVNEKEKLIVELLKKNSGKSFLEVGIGEYPHVERVKLINEEKISYTAADFEFVCNNHINLLTANKVDTKALRYIPNKTGSYSWSLFELLKEGKRYDLIFIDGHHTFYVDFNVFVLADRLLKPGGILLVDDISWSLQFLKMNMARSFKDWKFYRTMYNFDEYELSQQKMPHMKMIVDDYMVRELGYEVMPIGRTESTDCAALLKPAH